MRLHATGNLPAADWLDDEEREHRLRELDDCADAPGLTAEQEALRRPLRARTPIAGSDYYGVPNGEES